MGKHAHLAHNFTEQSLVAPSDNEQAVGSDSQHRLPDKSITRYVGMLSASI